MVGQPFPVTPSRPPRPGRRGPSPLLGVKLSIPRLPDTLVRRSCVLAELATATTVPLTTVTAPAGYGKTTAVAQWATVANLPVSWISLGPEDNNPGKFLSYLIASVQAADPDTLEEALEHASTLQEWRTTLDLVLAAMGLATRHFCLVLDDFHCVTNPQLLRAIRFLVNRLPVQAHLILISRAAPALPMARLRANGALYEIDVTDLAFSQGEALALRAATGLEEVDEAQWLSVATRTEGWIAGMQLARHSLKGQQPAAVEHFVATFDGRVQEIDEYLLEEVLTALPDTMRYFMLRSALLPFLGPELCDYVFETDHSTLFLRELRQRSLFVVTLGAQRQWLRYHQLIAEALQQRLAEEAPPEEIAAIHARTAEWLGEHGHEEEAIRHAIAGQRWDLATSLVHQVCAPLALSDRTLSMRYWLDLLPREVVLADPELRYLLLWSMAIMSEFSAMPDELVLIDRDHPDPSFQARAHTVRMQASYALGDVDGMEANARKALALTPAEMTPARINARIYLAGSRYLVGAYEEAEAEFAEVRRVIALEPEPWLRNRGEIRYVDMLCLQGKLDDAETLLELLEANMRVAAHVADAQVGWFKAGILLERNQLDLADLALSTATEITEVTKSDVWLPPVLVTRAMVAWARGDTEAAHASAQQARQVAKALGNPNFAQRADALQSMMWLARGQHILAERWLATANLDLTWMREFNQPYPALTAVRLLAARGELGRALTRLDHIIDATRARRRTGDLVRLHAIKAGFLVRCDEPDRAAAELATAIDFGAPGGFVRSFLDEGAVIAGLFNHPLIRNHTHRLYAQNLRRAFDGQPTGLAAGNRGQLEALSLRELEVLRLVSIGQSNRGIAADLYISEPTVKKHLSNILGKLDVLNRTQAVNLARELGIL